MALVLTLDSERNAELRVALDLRQEQLKKLRKNLEDAECSTHDVVRRLDVIDGMKADTEEQTDIEDEIERRARNGQGTLQFEGPLPPQSIDDAIEDAKREAARIIREQRTDVILMDLKPSIEPGSIVTDEELLSAIHARFDQVEYFDNDGDRGEQRYAGIHKAYFDDRDGQVVVWCGVTAGEIESSQVLKVGFYYDVLPDQFIPGNIMPTLGTDALIKAYRRLLNLPTAEEVKERQIHHARGCLLVVLGGDADYAEDDSDSDIETKIAFCFEEEARRFAEEPVPEGITPWPLGFVRVTAPIYTAYKNTDDVIEVDYEIVEDAICFLRDGVVPAFYYGVDPETFTLQNDTACELKIEGAGLVAEVREVLGFAPREASDAGEPNGAAGEIEESGETEDMTAPEPKRRRRRKAQVAEATTGLGDRRMIRLVGGSLDGREFEVDDVSNSLMSKAGEVYVFSAAPGDDGVFTATYTPQYTTEPIEA